jgi:hypothetical protein
VMVAAVMAHGEGGGATEKLTGSEAEETKTASAGSDMSAVTRRLPPRWALDSTPERTKEHLKAHKQEKETATVFDDAW